MSNRPLAWVEMMRIGYCHLGLEPHVFWDLTPAEFALLVGLEGASPSLTRSGLEELLARFPDRKGQRAQSSEEEQWTTKPT